MGAEGCRGSLGDDGPLDEVRQGFTRHLLELLDLLVPHGESVQEDALVLAEVCLQDAVQDGEHAALGHGVEALQQPPQGFHAVAVANGLNEPQSAVLGQHHKGEEQLSGGGRFVGRHGPKGDVRSWWCFGGRDHRREGSAQAHQVGPHLEVPLVPLAFEPGEDRGLPKAGVYRVCPARRGRAARPRLGPQRLDLAAEVRELLCVCRSRLVDQDLHRAFER